MAACPSTGDDDGCPGINLVLAVGACGEAYVIGVGRVLRSSACRPRLCIRVVSVATS